MIEVFIKKLTDKTGAGKVSKSLLIIRKAFPSLAYAITQSITNTFIASDRHIFILFPSNQINNITK